MLSDIRSRFCRPQSWFGAGAIVLASVASTACSEQGSAAQLNANAPVAITIRQTTISLQNRAGLPLTDVKLTVVPYGNTEFSKALGSLDLEESRDVMLSALSSSDGTSFNARLSNPKLVRLSATDGTGKRYDVEMPWK